MKTKPQKVKSVGYSYPTSPNAERFGFKSGCFCVSVGIKYKPLKAIAAFKTEAEALAYASTLPEPFLHYDLSMAMALPISTSPN